MPGAATTPWKPADRNRDSATPQATETSNRVVGRATGVPGGPVMKLAVTGRANEVASASTATPWAAWRIPMPMFHRRREEMRGAGSSIAGAVAGWLGASMVDVLANG